MADLTKPHRRFNPLTGEWVLVSPQRDRRPWLGKMEKTLAREIPDYDPDCYLCPGNSRAGGIRNPNYQGTFVFDNDFPAILPRAHDEIQAASNHGSAIFRVEEVSGICRVICFSERHDLTFPQLSPKQAADVVVCWVDQTKEISSLPDIRYVQVFENKGELMGCSNPHPHSQIWATSFTPDLPAREISNQQIYHQHTGGCLICDILTAEQKCGERIVVENEHFCALVPYWAIWPFEILLICKQHLFSLPELDADAQFGLSDILLKMTTCYDNLFEISFPYSFGFHQSVSNAPCEENNHLHAHFYPPLLRSADVKKFMVGFEMLAMPQRDFTPEMAAARLRELPASHYLSG